MKRFNEWLVLTLKVLGFVSSAVAIALVIFAPSSYYRLWTGMVLVALSCAFVGLALYIINRFRQEEGEDETPEMALGQQVRRAILAAKGVYTEPSFATWADNWLSGELQTAETAHAAWLGVVNRREANRRVTAAELAAMKTAEAAEWEVLVRDGETELIRASARYRVIKKAKAAVEFAGKCRATSKTLRRS